ncbi:SDR family oxidoreductase [Mammaliicoccus lentus]|uniref:SDR family oxidoreductase n=1 Tax=Mammaliicoccus lentus TaxID=42858 RepID=UPI001C4F23C5|nr:SDR family oxidoreductase [Mammaliicoccus lentus]MBW0762847.1 SDR family oxidoreductase [Mammaliicoccus lentus]
MENMFSLKNKIAIVTGGSGQLGKQYVRILNEYGAKVAIFDIQTEDYFDNDIIYLKTDITKKKNIEDSLNKTISYWGKPDILINNAAIDFPPNSEIDGINFEEFPESIYDNVMDVNVKGTWLCCQVIGKIMTETKTPSSIINISSLYGILSPKHYIYDYKKNLTGKEWYKPAAYSTSKSAIVNLTKYLSIYWAKYNIRVNTVSPLGIFNNQEKEFLDSFIPHSPMKRMANEDEINGTIIFLSSPASSYINGTNIIIDGGWSAW